MAADRLNLACVLAVPGAEHLTYCDALFLSNAYRDTVPCTIAWGKLKRAVKHLNSAHAEAADAWFTLCRTIAEHGPAL